MSERRSPYHIPMGRGNQEVISTIPPRIAERERDQEAPYVDPNDNLGTPQVTNWERPIEATEKPAIHPDDEQVARNIAMAMDGVYGAFVVCRGMEMSDKLLNVLDALKTAQLVASPETQEGF